MRERALRGSWQMQARSAASAGWRCGNERADGNLHSDANKRGNILRRFRKRGAKRSAFARPRRKSLRWVVPMEFMSTKRSRAPVDGRRGERGKSPVSVEFLLSKRFADANGKRSARGAASQQVPRRMNFFCVKGLTTVFCCDIMGLRRR